MNNLSKKAIALELTRMWCGQYGAPASSEKVLKVYKDNLKGLCEYNQDTYLGKIMDLLYEYDHKGEICEMDRIELIDSIREIVGGANSDS